MKILLLYDYPAHQSGLSILGEWVHKGLTSLKHEIIPMNLFNSQGIDQACRNEKFDLVLGVGYWNDAQRQIDIPKRYGQKVAVYWVSEGAIPAYVDVIKKCDLLLTTSQYCKEIFDRDVSHINTKVIYPGTDTEFYNVNRKVEPNKTFATFVSSGEVKGVEEAIYACKKLKDIGYDDFSYIIHIPFTEYPLERTYANHLEDLSGINGLSRNVKIVRGVKFPKEAMPRLYQSLNFYLAPWRMAGFGFPIIEAGACGVPTIAGNWKPMNEIVLNDQNGKLFKGTQKETTKTWEGKTFKETWTYGDPEDIALKIKDFFEMDSSMKNWCGSIARGMVIEKFETTKQIKKLEEELLKI
jgi:glycosyltransferase involved in cell wall biosynthesis